MAKYTKIEIQKGDFFPIITVKDADNRSYKLSEDETIKALEVLVSKLGVLLDYFYDHPEELEKHKDELLEIINKSLGLDSKVSSSPSKALIVRDLPKEDTVEVSEEKEKKHGFNLRSVGGRVGAIITATVLAFAAGHFISRSGSKQMVENNQRQEEQYTNPDPDYGAPLNLVTSAQSLNTGTSYSQSEFEEILGMINEATIVNTGELTDFLMGNSLTGEKHALSFDGIFTKGSIDDNAVDYFCQRRNKIVFGAYDSNNRPRTKSNIRNMLDDFLDFTFNGTTITNNGSSFCFNDLSPLAQYIIFQLGQSMLETTHDYSFRINNRQYTYDQLLDLVMDKFNVITQNLDSHNHIK